MLADGAVVGRIFKSNGGENAEAGKPWMWTILVIEHRENYTSTFGYAASREDAMGAFAKSWRRL